MLITAELDGLGIVCKEGPPAQLSYFIMGPAVINDNVMLKGQATDEGRE